MPLDRDYTGLIADSAVQCRIPMSAPSDLDCWRLFWGLANVLGIFVVIQAIVTDATLSQLFLAATIIPIVFCGGFCVVLEAVSSASVFGAQLSLFALYTAPLTLISFLSYFGLPTVGAPIFAGVGWYGSLFVAHRMRAQGRDRRVRLFRVWTTTLALLLVLVTTSLLITGVDAYGRYANLYTTYEQPLESKSPQGAVPLVAHVSDLHIAGRDHTIEGGTSGDGNLGGVAKDILDIGPRYVVISGDLTDSGTPSQWRIAEHWMASLRDRGITVIPAPGNHDLNAWYDGGGPEECKAVVAAGAPGLHDSLHTGYFLEATSNVSPLRTHDSRALFQVVAAAPRAPDETALASALNEYLRATDRCTRISSTADYLPEVAHNACMKEFRKTLPQVAATVDQEVAVATYWSLQDVFPLQFVDPDANVAVAVSDTTVRDARLARTAVAMLDDQQISRIITWMERLPASIVDVFLVLHHPINKRRRDRFIPPVGWSRTELLDSQWSTYAFLYGHWEKSTALAVRLLAASRSGRPRVHVFDGHRHDLNYGQAGGVTISEAASLGDLPFKYVTLWRTRDGNLAPVLRTVR